MIKAARTNEEGVLDPRRGGREYADEAFGPNDDAGGYEAQVQSTNRHKNLPCGGFYGARIKTARTTGKKEFDQEERRT